MERATGEKNFVFVLQLTSDTELLNTAHRQFHNDLRCYIFYRTSPKHTWLMDVAGFEKNSMMNAQRRLDNLTTSWSPTDGETGGFIRNEDARRLCRRALKLTEK